MWLHKHQQLHGHNRGVVFMKINREMLAWAAGFFDGEGCTYITNVKYKGVTGTYVYPGIRMSLDQGGDEAIELLSKFREATGNVGHIYLPKKVSQKENRKPMFKWHVSGIDKCQIVYSALWPFLSNTKREQIIKAATVALDHIRNPPGRLRGAPSHRVNVKNYFSYEGIECKVEL
jgi:hypothetical protein